MGQSYPLDQLAIIKQKRFDEAEKVLKEKKEAVEKAKEKLRAVEKERDEIKNHHTEKLTQLRAGLDEGLPAPKTHPMRTYLKIVVEKLSSHERKVVEQQKAVATAEQEVEQARIELLKRQKEVEKLKIHRKEWNQEMHKEEVRKENLDADELGATLHHRRKIQDQETE